MSDNKRRNSLGGPGGMLGGLSSSFSRRLVMNFGREGQGSPAAGTETPSTERRPSFFPRLSGRLGGSGNRVTPHVGLLPTATARTTRRASLPALFRSGSSSASGQRSSSRFSLGVHLGLSAGKKKSEPIRASLSEGGALAKARRDAIEAAAVADSALNAAKGSQSEAQKRHSELKAAFATAQRSKEREALTRAMATLTEAALEEIGKIRLMHQPSPRTELIVRCVGTILSAASLLQPLSAQQQQPRPGETRAAVRQSGGEIALELLAKPSPNHPNELVHLTEHSDSH